MMPKYIAQNREFSRYILENIDFCDFYILGNISLIVSQKIAGHLQPDNSSCSLIASCPSERLTRGDAIGKLSELMWGCQKNFFQLAHD
jgi:hypothetical protein